MEEPDREKVYLFAGFLFMSRKEKVVSAHERRTAFAKQIQCPCSGYDNGTGRGRGNLISNSLLVDRHYVRKHRGRCDNSSADFRVDSISHEYEVSQQIIGSDLADRI
jgi:hypothetical protein